MYALVNKTFEDEGNVEFYLLLMCIFKCYNITIYYYIIISNSHDNLACTIECEIYIILIKNIIIIIIVIILSSVSLEKTCFFKNTNILLLIFCTYFFLS